MEDDDFRRWSHRFADWAADYQGSLDDRPVRPRIEPGEVAAALADAPPEEPEPMERVFADFERLVPGAMTHWQHPRFFAYFPSYAARAGILAEQLASAMAAQCMLWQTSPAATELELRMVDWLRQAVGLPEGFRGVLQDTASSATLCALLTMRERALGWAGNREGLAGQPRVRVYTSEHAHASVEKAAWIAGLGSENLVRVPCDESLALDEEALAAAVAADRAAGHRPAGLVLSVGGTSVGATDRVEACCRVAETEGLFTHVDAAWAGSAMICPELRSLWRGIERADSLVFNPHKWLGAPLECSAHLVRDPEPLLRTLSLQPEYLQTAGREGVVDLSEWSVQLGRRFRALKLWFLLRAHGLEDLRRRIRDHIAWSRELAGRLAAEPDLELTSEPVLSLFTFRWVPPGASDPDAWTGRLLERVNDRGRIYLTGTRHRGRRVIRFVAGTFACRREDVLAAHEAILEAKRSLERG